MDVKKETKDPFTFYLFVMFYQPRGTSKIEKENQAHGFI